MTEFLLFTLYAPLASWGDIAVGEERGSWDRPSRSAILGLLGAALGLVREDARAHDALDDGYGVAVRLDVPGRPIVDYHTAQTAPEAAVRRRRPATRAAVLAAGMPETTVSRRVYREDALATVAIWARAQARWPLQELAARLREPVFVLYAGRKANALGLPVAPAIVRAATLREAFEQRAGPPALAADRLRPAFPFSMEVSHDACDGFDAGLEPVRRERRRDTAPRRDRWQFAERTVYVGLLPGPGDRSAQDGKEGG